MDGQDLFVAGANKDRCVDCGFCRSVLYCPHRQVCIGCGVCATGWHHEAPELVPGDAPRTTVRIAVDGQALSVPERITVKPALELVGLSIGVAWNEGDIPAPCGIGGCYSCLVLTDGQPVR
jgi:pyruvate formate lyase activating enzyme